MGVYILFKSGNSFECIPQIRLTTSKNGTTGTAIIEINIDQINFRDFPFDTICNVGLQKQNSFRMADFCHFIWSSGKPIKLLAIFLFSTCFEKQEFFNYYLSYASNNMLDFFPALQKEKNPTIERNELTS